MIAQLAVTSGAVAPIEKTDEENRLATLKIQMAELKAAEREKKELAKQVCGAPSLS